GGGREESVELKTLVVLAAVDGQPLDIVPTYLGAHVVPPQYQDNPDAYIAWMCDEMMPRIRRQRRASFVDIYCDRGAFTVDQARRYLACAHQLGFELKIHAEQFTHTGAVRLGIEMGATSA